MNPCTNCGHQSAYVRAKCPKCGFIEEPLSPLGCARLIVAIAVFIGWWFATLCAVFFIRVDQDLWSRYGVGFIGIGGLSCVLIVDWVMRKNRIGLTKSGEFKRDKRLHESEQWAEIDG